MMTSEQQYPFNYYRPVFDDLANINQHQLLATLCDEISKHLPGCLETYDLVSYGYSKAKRFAQSVMWGERALISCPDEVAKTAVRFNLSKCLMAANQPEMAVRYLQENLQLHPDDSDYVIDYAVAVYATNQKDHAEQILRKLQAQHSFPDAKTSVVVNFNLGIHEIRRGNFRQGLKQISSGRSIKIWGSNAHNYPVPQWQGQPAPGSRLLVVGEGGAGDEIINVRFVKHLQQQGMQVDWASAHGLAEVFGRMPFHLTQNYKNLTNDIANITDYDYWTPAMNLPVYLDLDHTDLWSGAYLTADADYVAKWQPVIKSKNRIAMGVRWGGNPLYDHDLHRGLPVDQLWAAIQDIPADFFSLQRDENTDQIHHCEGNMTDLSSDLASWDDTLAVIDSLDVVVTSCTSVAHIAAAMGKRTIVLVPIVSYYVWAQETTSSYWYGDNVTVLRQIRPRDWSEPLQQLRSILQTEFGQPI
jgi:tetratricopeptide (TPR) repeat protein